MFVRIHTETITRETEGNSAQCYSYSLSWIKKTVEETSRKEKTKICTRKQKFTKGGSKKKITHGSKAPKRRISEILWENGDQ